MKYLCAVLLMLLSIPAISALSSPPVTAQPDPTFRFNAIERRLDQMQSRLDLLEREVRSGPSIAQSRPDSTAELRQQYLGLSEQVSFIQIQLVEARKAIDRLNDAEARRIDTKEPQKSKDEKKKP